MLNISFLTTARNLRRLLLATVACLAVLNVCPRLDAQSQTVSGDLGVTGEMDVYGNTLNFGSWANDATKFGLGVTYAEDASHVSLLTLTNTRPASAWLWQRAPASGTAKVPQMGLSSGNALILYDLVTPTPNAAIVLDPLGTSTFATSTTFNGTDNKMPNQTITGSGSVLTVGLADARYTVHTIGTAISLGGNSSVSGSYATALGGDATANGLSATALGAGAHAVDGLSTAVGANTYAAAQSIAMGYFSSATGGVSMAIGYQASASGPGAMAIGNYSYSSGDGSVAVGPSSQATAQSSSAFAGATASGNGSLALGSGSLASGFWSSALGLLSKATAQYAESVGTMSTASGYATNAVGEGSLASGDYAATFGSESAATGWLSLSLGSHSAATGTAAVAVGDYSLASGSDSTALTNSSVASGDFAVAAGRTEAASLYQCTVGAYGVAGGDAHTWVATDDLFTVGNGQSAAARSNAFSVKKNGNATFQGVITAAPGGDIPMYTGN